MHGILFFAALGFLLIALWLGFRGFRFPLRTDALRRLEADSGLEHRPLFSLEDKLAAGRGDPASEALWQAHQAKQRERLGAVRLGQPQPGLARRDPMALRFLVLLLLTAAIFMAGSEWEARLAQAFHFGFGAGTSQPIRLDAWINPPAYTGAPPVFLLQGDLPKAAAAPLSIAAPQGSTLVLRVYGAKRVPKLSFTAKGARRASDKALSAQQEGVFAIEEALRRDGLLSLRRGARVLARFAVSLKPDMPPKIALAEPIRVTRQGALRLSYRIEDDFGVSAVTLRLKKDAGSARAEEAALVPLPLAARRTRSAKLQSYVDLTAHPWAGLSVTLTLLAKDEAGQEGASAPVALTLPERPFTDPLARALIEQRKILARDPARAREVARFLEAATLSPERFTPSTGLYLGLRAAYWRLLGGGKQAIKETGNLLWQIAIALEEGDRARAEDALEAARKDLMEALERNAPDEEIERLLAELKEALERYLSALEAEAMRALAEGRLPAMPPPDARTISRSDFERLLEAIGSLSRTGARDAARELLSGLDEILQNLATGFAQAPLPGTPEEAANEALQALSELIGKERGLMDETFRQSMRAGEEDKAGEEGRTLGAQQDALRRTLGTILEGLGDANGKIPGSFGRADQAMREAERALKESRWPRALESEKEALEALRAGAQALAEQAFAGGAAGGMARGAGRQATDPFGRPSANGGADLGGSVKVPDTMELRRAREILEEIERRASERSRPKDELDYFERLLKRF